MPSRNTLHNEITVEYRDPLSVEEEQELSNRVQNGDVEAAHEMMRAGIRLIVQIALKNHTLWMKFGKGEIVQKLWFETYRSLLRGNFDPTKSRFSTWVVKGCVLRCRTHYRTTILTTPLPSSKHNRFNPLDRSSTLSDRVKMLELESQSHLDKVRDSTLAAAREVVDLLESLSPRLRRCLFYKLIERKGFREIGRIEGYSRTRAHQFYVRGLRCLRNGLKDDPYGFIAYPEAEQLAEDRFYPIWEQYKRRVENGYAPESEAEAA